MHARTFFTRTAIACAAALTLAAHAAVPLPTKGLSRLHDGRPKPVRVEVSMPQTAIVVLRGQGPSVIPVVPGSFAGGAIAGGIAAAVGAARERSLERQTSPVVASLESDVGPSVVRKLFDDALAERPPARCMTDGAGLAADERPMQLRLHYQFTPIMDRLLLQMHASRPGQAAANGKATWDFSNAYIYDIPAGPHRLFKAERDTTQYWLAIDRSEFRAELAAGARELLAMLDADCGRPIPLGVQPGRPVGWGGMYYGVVDRQEGQRQWIRLRDGRMVSTPKAD